MTLPLLVAGVVLVAVQDSFNGLSLIGLALIVWALVRVLAGFAAFNDQPFPAEDADDWQKWNDELGHRH